MIYRQAGSSTTSYSPRAHAVATPFSEAEQDLFQQHLSEQDLSEQHLREFENQVADHNPQSGKLLAFVERHEMLVQLIPFFLAVALILLSFVSENLSEGMRMLSIAEPRF
jgi:hypothetical protein